MRGRALFLLLLSGTACVAQDAGYADTRRALERAHVSARWRAVDEAFQKDDDTRALLAKPLDVEAAVRVAMLNNADVQSAFEELGVARANLVSALRLPNPVVQGSVHFHNKKPDMDFGVLFALTDLVFLAVRSGAAQAELEAAKLATAGTILDLALEVRTAYYRYVAARELVEFRRQILLAARSAADAASELHRAGNITTLDWHNQRALYEDQRLLEARAESDRVRERARLEALLGLSGSGVRWETLPHLPTPEQASALPADSTQRALEKSLDLELVRRRFTAAAKRKNLARTEALLPELSAGVMAEKEQDEVWGFGPTFQIELPLLYQGAGEVAHAESTLRRERNRYRGVAQQIRAAIQEVQARFETARASAAFYRDVQLPLREQIVSETQLQFNAMNASIFQLLQAKRDQIEAESAYIETLRELWIARSEADQLLSGRLVRIREPLSSPPSSRPAPKHD